MKIKFILSVLLLMMVTLARGQVTAFTYQGRLNDGTAPANGVYDMAFTLYGVNSGGAAIAGPLTNNAVGVTNGLFVATIDFGPGPFTGSSNWMEIAVRTNGTISMNTLAPRQQLTPTPYAIFANTASNLSGSVASASLSGIYGNALTLNNAANQLIGTFIGNGMNVSNVNALSLGGLNATNFWQLGGNNVSAGQFIGSTNNQPVEFWVNGGRALRLEPNAGAAANVIGGSQGNFVLGGVVGATVGGGGDTNSFNSLTNSVTANFGTVGGGLGNNAGSAATVGGGQVNSASSLWSTVGGGQNNIADGNSGATVGGGMNNHANGLGAIVAGGVNNTASGYAFVGGGYNNHASGPFYGSAFVGGGQNNTASGDYASIPGGDDNMATGTNSFAAGHIARAVHDGAFVWADLQNSLFSSTSSNQFSVRANGGVRFVTSGTGITLDGQPVLTISNSLLGFSLQQNPGSGAPNVIEGSQYNFVSGGVVGATVSGGGATNFSNAPFTNNVTGSFGTVGGGRQNTANLDGTVAGGVGNSASAVSSTVSGGSGNTASGNLSVVVGGLGNTASGSDSMVGGGDQNSATGQFATVAGGQWNVASGIYSTVPGGESNLASGFCSVAAGRLAQATNSGSFVWADSQAVAFTSTANDSFNVRAKGGVSFVTSGAGLMVDGQPVLGGSGLRVTASTTDAPDVVNGAAVNLIDGGVKGAIIAGGGTTNFNGAASSNHISSDFGGIVGGSGNVIQPGADHSFIGGGWNNDIGSGAYQSVITGGWDNTNLAQSSVIGGGQNNLIATGDHSVIAGGFQNSSGQQYSTVGGGIANSAIAFSSSVGGGEGNLVSGNLSSIGGGYTNSIGGGESTIAGGEFNSIPFATAGAIGGGNNNQVNSSYGVIAGGDSNIAGNYGAVPGGQFNTASGTSSFAAGHQAKAVNTGAFVWADSQAIDFSSTASDQFLIRARGGVGINTNTTGGASLYVSGFRTNGWANSVAFFENTSTATNAAPALRVVCDGGTNTDGALSVSSNGKGLIAEFGNAVAFVVAITNDGTIYSKGVALTSDRNAKENFTPLDSKMVLAKVAAMPVTTWNYKDDSADKKHIGPVAQDFCAAFGLNGGDDRHISVVDEGGVALAAIQGLNRKVEDGSQKAEVRMQQLEEENADLRERLEKLERLLSATAMIHRE